MKKNLIRFAGGFMVLLGLAYVGHQVFVKPVTGGPKATAGPVAGAAPVTGASAYVVYPDRETEKAYKLDYPIFSGDFVQAVTVTPLPPHLPGAVMLRVQPGAAKAIEISLNELRCASPVHVVFYRISDRVALARAVLDTASPTLSIPFGDGVVPPALLEIRMDDKASNNYWCGVGVRWSR